ncbi:MAG: SDR family oxidoreductase [Bacteroidota bacterium]
MKILIIGSYGYLGSRLIIYLRNMGYKVVGIDIGYYLNTDDTKDYATIGTYEFFDVIILLAGHSSPTLCDNDVKGSIKNNVTNFSNLIYSLNKNQRLLYASSASVCNGLVDAKETTQLNAPISNYDCQKQIIEKISLCAEATTIAMRFGTVAGYSENPRLDSMINSFYYDAVNTGEINVTNGENMRSYLGMNDLCEAVLSLINLDKPEKIYNIASGTDSINNIAQKVADITGAKINLKDGDSKYSFWVNCDRINEVVQMTDTIESICADMGDMPTKNKNIYNRNTNLFTY